MTLNEQEWKEVEQLVNGEYMTQVDDAGFHAVLAGVKLALAIVNQEISLSDLQDRAIAYLGTYGHIPTLPVNDLIRHALHVHQYGSEEEAIAQERFDALYTMLKPDDNDHVRLWHQDAQQLWHLLESYKEARGWIFYYEQGTDPQMMLFEGASDYLTDNDLDNLFTDIMLQKKFDIHLIPTERWTVVQE